ncbi:MarR family winged helix-turn-helix transcriptional regulator [Actinoplanes sp. NPDC049668]|uniref:MarR family winged helix-turn-helix transcriptional regulator n=1 Tax=unclassified Actinoplanes TaxID=2626549 RepID=UPI0033AC47E4
MRSGPSLLYLVKQLELAVRARLDELVRGAGITALQYTALTVLERHDGLSAAQLARDSFVTAQSIADMVRALENRGLISRERDAANRRELRIHLTAEGQRLLASFAAPVRELEDRMISKLTPEQAAEFRQSLIGGWQAVR